MRPNGDPDRGAREGNPEAGRPPTVELSAAASEAANAAPTDLAPGRVVRHYELVRELGRGGMGRVFLARDLRLARLCAIKFLLAYRGGDPARFLAEARVTARCRHDNIVAIHEADEIDGCPYMVLEYLEGRTLRAWLTARGAGAVPPGTAIELMLPVVRALSYAHELGVVHRDLKPENVFLTDAGPIKVLDFGVAKLLDAAEDLGLTGHGARVGTPAYMSPEQWLGQDITPRSDLWALGILLHELVTGAHPLAPADLPRLREVPDLSRAMPNVRRRHPALGELGGIIDRCLAKRPADRIASARQLLAELEPLIAEPSARPRRRRRSVTLVTCIAIAIAAGAAGLGVVVRCHRATPRGIAITDPPLPASQSPAARAAYNAALHGLRDASSGAAEAQLRQAIALDPTLAAGQLRLAILLDYTVGRGPEARRRYALAVQWRVGLSARDREILAVFEWLFHHDPPELVRFNAELTELARRRPDDAEVLALLAYFGTDGPEVKLHAARRAVAIDPEYADGWQAVGKQLFALGRTDEALRGFDACLAVSPAAVDCLGERAGIHAAQGHCAAAEADLRNADAANPEGRYWRDLWASSLIALGKPAEATLEVLGRKWAAQPEPQRELVELDDRARLDLLRGDFDAARTRATVLRERTRLQADADQHDRYAGLLIDLAIETDRLDDAAQVAEDYLRRREGWVSAGSILDEIEMLTVLRDTGRLSAAEFEARRAAWLAGHRELSGDLRGQIWLAAWARPAATADAARIALAAAPTADLHAVARTLVDHAVIGALLLRAGRAGEAIAFLERAARGCDGFLAPAAHVRAAAKLGEAREVTGDRAGACAAYQLVLRRWRAPSVTARAVELRSAALACAPANAGG